MTPDEVMSHIRRLVPGNWITNSVDGFHVSVSGGVIAVIGQEVIVQLPEYVQCDTAIWRRHVVIGLAEQRLKIAEAEVLREKLVSESVTF